MNDYQLTEYCNGIAQDIARDARDFEQAREWASESADGSEYVIYTYKAHKLCLDCNVDAGEEFVSQIGEPVDGWTYDGFASAIAYGEIHSRIESALWAIFEAREEGAA